MVNIVMVMEMVMVMMVTDGEYGNIMVMMVMVGLDGWMDDGDGVMMVVMAFCQCDGV